jgi:hypothetical protein
VVVTDVGDAVGDDRRELDHRAEAAAPDDPKRRSDADPRVRLGPRRCGPVHRPLEPFLVDADDDPPPALERHPERTLAVSVGAHRHDEWCPPA